MYSVEIESLPDIGRKTVKQIRSCGENVVHTARRYYRLNGLVRPSDRPLAAGNGSRGAEKLVKLGHLEEVNVVTRFP